MIPTFYEDREIFVTGGSGVVGKALIEKLLRSCNVRKIYMLLRPKKSVNIQARLESIKQEMLFRRLRAEKPNAFDEKVVVIPGDVEKPLLGISPENVKLMENVSIVFHSAATTRFDEPLVDAIKLNVGGTLGALKFAETLKHLKVFMHVSTFFSNPYLEFVEAKWYKPPMDWKFCLDLIQRNDVPEETLDFLTRKLIVGFPNTYCFTKNVAESLANEYRRKLPVVIYRPSIVVFAIDEPEPGFPTNLTGLSGLFGVSATGLLKTVYSRKNQRLDFSPLDITVKCMAYYGLKSAEIYASGPPEEIPVFQTSSFSHMTLSYTEVVDIIMDNQLYEEAALEKSFLLPGVQFTDSRLLYLTLVLFKQIIPSLIGDLLLMLCGRQPLMLRVQRRMLHTLDVMLPFRFNMYESTGISYAEEMLKLLDRTDFHVNSLRTIMYPYVFLNLGRSMVYRIREVLFKEDPSTLPRSRRIMKVKKILYRIFQIYLIHKIYQIIIHRIYDWQWNETDHTSTNISDNGIFV